MSIFASLATGVCQLTVLLGFLEYDLFRLHVTFTIYLLSSFKNPDGEDFLASDNP